MAGSVLRNKYLCAYLSLMESFLFRNKYLFVIATILAVAIAILYVRESQDFDENDFRQLFTVNRGLIGEPESLDHHQFSSDQAAEVLRDTGEGLIALAADGGLVPGVAESWTISDDGLLYRFNIREDASWSNGERITARNFVSTYRSLVDPARAAINANAIQAVKNADEIINGEAEVASLGVSAISDAVLEVELETSTPYFLQLLTHPSLYPVYSSNSNGSGVSRNNRISNGAYILDGWTKGSEITLVKNQRYWNSDNVFFETVKYHIVDEGAEFNRFRAGELDITGTVASGIFSIAQRDYPNELKVSPRLGVYYYGFNLNNPLFTQNLELRRALSLAIDRNLLVEKIVARGEEPAFGWVPPGTFNYESQTISELKLDNQERESLARQQFEAAGYGAKKALKIELRYNESDVQERIALAISAMWREVLGVEVELVSEEFQVLLANIRAQDKTDIFRLSWTGNYNDPQTFLELFESDHPQNLSGYRNTEFDNLIRAAGAEIDMSKRMSILESAERMAIKDHPVIPIYFYVSKHLVSRRIDGWVPNIMDAHLSQYLRVR